MKKRNVKLSLSKKSIANIGDVKGGLLPGKTEFFTICFGRNVCELRLPDDF